MSEATYILIDILTVIGVVFVGLTLFAIFNPPPKADVNSTLPPKEDCKLHKWTYHPETNRMTCTECSLVAGTYATSNGEYGGEE
jgi:hypothetical protein